MLCMSFLGNSLSVNAFQDEVAHYSLSLANPKSVSVSPEWRACIPPSPISPLMAMQPSPSQGNLSRFNSLSWQKSNLTKKCLCVFVGGSELNWLGRDMLLLAHGKGQVKPEGGTVVERKKGRKIFLYWCLQGIMLSIMYNFILS